MINQPLLDYLKGVLKLEVDQYICEETIRKNNAELHRLQEERKIDPPVQGDIEKTAKERVQLEFYDEAKKKDPKGNHTYILSGYGPKLETKPRKPGFNFGLFFTLFMVLTIAVAIVLFVVLFIIVVFVKPSMNFWISYFKILLISLIATFVILLIFSVYSEIKYKKSYPEKYKKVEEENQEIIRNYKERLEIEKEKIKEKFNREMEEYRNKVAALDTQIESMIGYNRECQNTRSNIQDSLRQMYDVGIIHPDYRSIVPVSMFINYIEKERCYRLEGPTGAYNKYEDDLRANIIISKLDRISSSLGSIQSSMGTLYGALSLANASIHRLSQSISNQSAIQEFNSRILADRTDALASIGEANLREIKKLNQQVSDR